MSKRKGDIIFDDQENTEKKPKGDKIETINEAKNPLQEINPNAIATKIANAIQDNTKSKNENDNDDVKFVEEADKDEALNDEESKKFK